MKVDWGWAIKIWGNFHATPTIDTHISVYLLSQVTLFWGHSKSLNFPLEDDLQLFPGLDSSLVIIIVAIKRKCMRLRFLYAFVYTDENLFVGQLISSSFKFNFVTEIFAKKYWLSVNFNFQWISILSHLYTLKSSNMNDYWMI